MGKFMFLERGGGGTCSLREPAAEQVTNWFSTGLVAVTIYYNIEVL